MSTTCLRTPTRPDQLVGKWVHLDRDGGRPPHLGVLARATPDPDHPGLWHWGLRTPTGYMAAGPHLPATRLTREHTADVARARRALSRELHTDRAVLADLLAHSEPAGAMARAVAALEELQVALAAATKLGAADPEDE